MKWRVIWMIHIVGTGPGSPDLITVRGQKLFGKADMVIYVGSLVNPEPLDMARGGALIYNSTRMTLEEVIGTTGRPWEVGLCVVHLHTGGSCTYGAIQEQMNWMDGKGTAYDICPGVSSFCGVVAALGMEYTLPGVVQNVMVTRMADKTPAPEQESIRGFASHGVAITISPSTRMVGELSQELMEGGYKADTPAAIIYKATWPEEKVVRYTVGTLREATGKEHITKTALAVAGDSATQKGHKRFKLYGPGLTTMYREGKRAPGTMYTVGIGPGNVGQMAGEALETLRRCQVIAGYTVHVDLVREHLPQKGSPITATTQEEERCHKALEYCMEEKDTTMICNGDTGIYGMAGLILELSKEYPEMEAKIMPGVTAAYAGGTALGAPLVHDFVVVSLSDRLIPPDTIRDRTESAVRANFVMCIYNPASKERPNYLRQTYRRTLKYRSGDTVCGLMANIGREEQSMEVLSSEEAKGRQVDMSTIVHIGNSHTKQVGPYMVTPGGYRHGKK